MPISNPALKNPLSQVGDASTGYVNSVLQSVFSIFFIVGIIYFIWHFMMGAFHFISQEGDPKKIETAKHEFTYAFLGLGVMFVVFAILKLIGYITGIKGLDTLQLSWPTL